MSLVLSLFILTDAGVTLPPNQVRNRRLPGRRQPRPEPATFESSDGFAADAVGRVIDPASDDDRVLLQDAFDPDACTTDPTSPTCDGTTTVYVTSTDREYVYHPDGDLNEYIILIDKYDVPVYVVQDGNLNVVALVDAAGAVLRQYSYSPYGELLETESFGTHADNHIGFQGMLFDRITAPGNSPTLVVGADGLYLTPNRSYSPTLGRWMQRDPNQTAQPTVASPAMHGESPGYAGFLAFNLDSLYDDGLSIYLFATSNPITGRDALGLSHSDFDYFGEADELTFEITGQKIYTLGAINEGARWASLSLQIALDVAGALLGVDVISSIGAVTSGRGGFWEGMDVLLAVTPIGKLRNVGGVLAKAAKFRRGAKGAAKLTLRAKRRLAKMLGGIPRSAQPTRQGRYRKNTKWWEYKDHQGKTKIVVEHPDGSVHVGTPKPQSTHRSGGPPKYYPVPGTGHVGE